MSKNTDDSTASVMVGLVFILLLSIIPLLIGMRMAGIIWSFAIWWCLSYLIIAPLIMYAVPVLGIVGFVLSLCYLLYFKIDLGWLNGISLGFIALVYLTIISIKYKDDSELNAQDQEDAADEADDRLSEEKAAEVIISSTNCMNQHEKPKPKISECSGCGAKPSKRSNKCEYCDTTF